MQNIINSAVKDEIVDIKQKSLFARLKRLFSTDVIVRNVGGKQLKIKDTDSVMYAMDKNSLKDRFNRIRSTSYNAYSRDFSLAYQSSRMDLFRDYDCVGPDTIIPLPDGTYPTIKELAEKYKDKPQERFHVFSYDHETDSIKLGNAYHPRKKGTQKAWKVTFDNDKFEVSTDDHLFLCRNGVYKKLKELSVGESMMPFYQKEFYGRGYRFIYNFSKKWQPEHRIVAEQFYRKVDKTEVVHHKNFKKNDNRPNNLQIMGKHAHAEYHMNLSTKIIWSPENKQKTLEKVRNSHGYKNRKFHKWNGERQGEKNPFFGKSHTIQSNELRSTSLKQALKDRNYYNEKNPNFRSELTVDVLKIKAVDYYKEKGKLDIFGLCEYIGCDYSLVKNRVSNWKTFKDNIISTLNHKIKSIEYIGEVDVYDLSVETYHNFATNNVFIHNCMDFDPIIAAALDVVADECVTYNEMGKILTVKSSDNNVKEILDNLFTDILNVPFNLWSWTRNMCKYGDFFLKLYISPEYGIYMVEPLSSYNVERIENADPYNKRYVKFQIRPTDTSQAEILENYQVAHFRLLSDSNFLPYGKSYIEGSRRIWKQLSLMEDAMLIHRVMRAPEKRIFYTDIGNIPPAEVDTYMEKLISKMKKVPYLDEKTGDYNLRFNLQNMVEDYFIPVRGGDSGTKIDTLSGMDWTGIDDIDYLKNKLLASLKIPKAFLNYDESAGGKSTLANEDLRFSRTIQRIQKILISELTKIAIIHLYAQGYRDEHLVDFELELTNPSTIAEKEKIEIWSDKVSVASDMLDNKVFSTDWIYKHVFNMSEDDILQNKLEIVEDTKQRHRLTKIEEEGEDIADTFNKIDISGEPGESGGDMGGDSGGGGLPDLGGPEDKSGGAEPKLPDLGAGGGGEGAGAPKELKETKIIDKNANPEHRDQTGRKKANEVGFGADPLGTEAINRDKNENSERRRKSDLKPNPRTRSQIASLRLQEERKKISQSKLTFTEQMNNGTVNNLTDFLKRTRQDIKKELISEVSNKKSLLDETNILE